MVMMQQQQHHQYMLRHHHQQQQQQQQQRQWQHQQQQTQRQDCGPCPLPLPAPPPPISQNRMGPPGHATGGYYGPHPHHAHHPWANQWHPAYFCPPSAVQIQRQQQQWLAHQHHMQQQQQQQQHHQQQQQQQQQMINNNNSSCYNCVKCNEGKCSMGMMMPPMQPLPRSNNNNTTTVRYRSVWILIKRLSRGGYLLLHLFPPPLQANVFFCPFQSVVTANNTPHDMSLKIVYFEKKKNSALFCPPSNVSVMNHLLLTFLCFYLCGLF